MSEIISEYGGIIAFGVVVAVAVGIKKFAFTSNKSLSNTVTVNKSTTKGTKSNKSKSNKTVVKKTTQKDKTPAELAKAKKNREKAQARKARRAAEKLKKDDEKDDDDSDVKQKQQVTKKNKKKKKKAKKKPVVVVKQDSDDDDSDNNNNNNRNNRNNRNNYSDDDDNDDWTTVKIKKSNSSNNNNNDDDDNDDENKGPKLDSKDFEIDPKHYGAIIGDKGSNLNALVEHFDVTIDVPNRKEATRFVTLTGKTEDIYACKRQIDILIEKGYCRITHPDTTDASITVPEDKRNVVIGPKGAHIKAIQEACNVKINMPNRSSDSDKCFIIGKKDDVKRAKLLVKQLIMTGFNQVTHPGLAKKELSFPFDKIALLVGPNGHTIKSIQGNTRCKINTPKALGMPLVIIGKPEDIFLAEKEIHNVLNPPVITLDDLATQTDNAWAKAQDYGSWDYQDSIVISA